MSAFPPPRTALAAALKITAAVMLPVVVVAAAVGGAGVHPAILGILSVVFVPFCSLRQSIGLSAVLVAIATIGTAVSGDLWAVVSLVVVTCLIAGLLSRFSAGVFSVAPSVAAISGMVPDPASAVTVLLVMSGVCAYVVLVVHVLKVHKDPRPVATATAIRHALVMAVACGGATFAALYYDLPRGYWVVMTLAVVLLPYTGDSLVKARQRVVGTILGAVLAVLLSPLPRPWQVVLAAVCMTLVFAYIALGDYVLQVTFMTPMIVFLVSSGSVNDTFYADGLRVAYTVGACVVGGLLSLALASRPDAADMRSA